MIGQMKDEHYMQEAIALARKPLQAPHPNPRVGCVIAHPEKGVLGRGWHEAAGASHAERLALASLEAPLEPGVTLYTTLEPCVHEGRTPPCISPIIASGIQRVVIAMLDPNPLVKGKGIAALKEKGIRVEVGIGASEALALNKGFVSRHARGRPWVRAKVGMSLDGRIALKNGASQWITCATARREVHIFRAQSDVILTGVGTILADDPKLTTRLEGVTFLKQPLRVIMDRTGRTPKTSQVFQEPGETWIVHSPLKTLMERLQEAGYQEIWVEAGPTLLTSLWKEQLIDEWVLYVAPVFLGDAARSPLQAEFTALSQATELAWQSVTRVGNCLRLIVEGTSS